MHEPEAIASFLKAANLSLVAKHTRVTRPTLYKIRKRDFSTVQYHCMRSVSDFMDDVYEGRLEVE